MDRGKKKLPVALNTLLLCEYLLLIHRYKQWVGQVFFSVMCFCITAEQEGGRRELLIFGSYIIVSHPV